MWKLLPVCLLVSCAVNDQQQPAGSGKQSGQASIVRQVELPVESSAEINNGQSAKKTFHRQGVQGWLDETGAWRIEGEVHHGRLRCASYEMGIQLGRGNPACADVEWLTGVEYATRVRQCNSASRLHAGGGEFSNMATRFDEVSCVRVLVRCEGAC
jgi:hypothetical protein